MAKKLGDYLDHLIDRAYVTVTRKFGGDVVKSHTPTEYAIRNYIEDERTGWSHPIDDSADHFLLTKFHQVREALFRLPVPKGNGIFGTVWTQGEVGPGWHTNEVSGEIPWRAMDQEGRKPCYVCKEPEDRESLPYCSRPHLPLTVCMREGGYYVGPEISGRAIPLKDEEDASI